MKKYRAGYYCSRCNDHTSVFAKRQPNHILHIILSILTGGMWLLVYAIVALESTRMPNRCVKCGHKVDSKPVAASAHYEPRRRPLQPGQAGYTEG